MKEIRNYIERLGQEMVACSVRCEGISCDQAAGILPRCLIFESEDRAAAKGCVAVGFNPGRAKAPETEYYRTNGATYESILAYWRLKIRRYPYYQRIRRLTSSIGLDGPILWSELAKCESKLGQRGLPLKTLRTCTGHFLSRELEAVPPGWPLIGIGQEAYKVLAYRYPQRTVIGVPHPTGGYGDVFSRHLPGGRSHEASNAAVRRVLSEPHGLLWLGDIGRAPRGG